MIYVQNPTPEDYRRAGLGYGLGPKNKSEYAYQYDRQEQTTRNLLWKVQERIEWAYASYEKALVDHRGNIKLYTDLTLNWSPQRVLTTYKYFGKLCALLNEEWRWRLLDRKQRKFIAEAYRLWVDRRR